MSAAPRLAVQLFTVRDQFPRDPAGVLQRISELGYEGVETAFVGEQPYDAHRRLFEDHGLAVAAVHVPLPVGPAFDAAVREATALGTRTVVWHGYPRDARYDDLDGVRRLADELADVGAAFAREGLAFLAHNHWWEIADLGGYVPFGVVADTAQNVGFELDTYWSALGGADPHDVVRRILRGRVPLVHLKDGPLDSTESPMLALGEGAMDLDATLDAVAGADWWIVELDHHDGDVFDALARSHDFLVSRRPPAGT